MLREAAMASTEGAIRVSSPITTAFVHADQTHPLVVVSGNRAPFLFCHVHSQSIHLYFGCFIAVEVRGASSLPGSLSVFRSARPCCPRHSLDVEANDGRTTAWTQPNDGPVGPFRIVSPRLPSIEQGSLGAELTLEAGSWRDLEQVRRGAEPFIRRCKGFAPKCHGRNFRRRAFKKSAKFRDFDAFCHFGMLIARRMQTQTMNILGLLCSAFCTSLISCEGLRVRLAVCTSVSLSLPPLPRSIPPLSFPARYGAPANQHLTTSDPTPRLPAVKPRQRVTDVSDPAGRREESNTDTRRRAEQSRHFSKQRDASGRALVAGRGNFIDFDSNAGIALPGRLPTSSPSWFRYER